MSVNKKISKCVSINKMNPKNHPITNDELILLAYHNSNLDSQIISKTRNDDLLNEWESEYISELNRTIISLPLKITKPIFRFEGSNFDKEECLSEIKFLKYTNKYYQTKSIWNYTDDLDNWKTHNADKDILRWCIIPKEKSIILKAYEYYCLTQTENEILVPQKTNFLIQDITGNHINLIEI